MPKIHALCSILHELTNRAEADLNYYLDRIERQNESGFSPQTLLAIQMVSDETTLRALADRIKAAREQIVSKPNEQRAA